MTCETAITVDGLRTVIRVSGEVTSAAAESVARVLAPLLSRAGATVVVDLSPAQVRLAAALQPILAAEGDRGYGSALRLVAGADCPCAAVVQAEARAAQLPLFESVDAALASR